MAKADEIDRQVELEMQQKADQCSEFGATVKTFSGTGGFYETTSSVCDVLDANDEIVAKLIDNIMEEKQRPGRIQPGEVISPMFQTTANNFKSLDIPELDLDKL